MFGRISLGKWGMIIGGIIALGGFVAYGVGNATLNLAGFFYGIPLFLIGLALKSAELKPTPKTRETPPQIEALREQQATSTQKQILKDVTRYRYGQEVHLQESLERLGLSPTDEERPLLDGLHETETDGAYTLVLEFASPLMPFETWEEKQPKIERFFGPGVRAKLSQPTPERVELALVAALEEA